MTRCSIWIVILACAVVAPRGARAANPEDPGPLQFTRTARTERIAGQDVTFDLFVPQGLGAPAPLVVVGHGFQRNKDRLAGWGEALARRGYVAAAPNFPGVLPDHQVNGAVVSGLLDWLAGQGAVAGSPLAGLADGSRRGVIGHSAGGLSAYVAAAKDPTIAVVVGLDPVDSNDIGKGEVPGIAASTMIVRAAPGVCNSQGNAEQIYQAFGGPKVTLRVKGANHCDPESPSDAFCGLFCGGDADPARHQLFRRYAFAMLDYVLRCDDQMIPWIAGASAQSDAAIEDLRFSGLPPLQASCTPPATDDAGPAPDGGTAPDGDGPPVDGPPAAGDAAPAADGGPLAGADAAATGGAGGDDGGGCGCQLERRGGAAPGLLLAALLAVLLLRRRPSSQPRRG